MTRRDDRGHPCLAPALKGEACGFSPSSVMSAVCFPVDELDQVEDYPVFAVSGEFPSGMCVGFCQMLFRHPLMRSRHVLIFSP